MKNFFKKLSFVLASAMVITSLYAPANTSAAAKDGIILKGKAVTKKGIFVGGEKVNFDYKIGKHNNKGANGKWSVSDTSVITVDKHGKVTAVGTGDATLYLKVKKNAKKGIKKNLTFKVKLNAMARADKLTIPASDKAITLKVGEVKDIMPVLTDKVEGVKNTYNLFAKSSDDSVATAKAENGKVVVEAKMATSSAVTVTVFAAQKNSAEEAMNNKYKVEDSFTVTVMSPLEASQVKANKVLVKGADFSKVTTSGAFEVKDSKGNVLKFKEAVTLNAEKNEATLEYENSQIPVEKYSLKFGELTSEFMVEKARVKEIKITPEKEAVLDQADNKVARAYYNVFDQFGEDVTQTVLGANVKVTGSGVEEKRGIIKFTNTTSDFIVGVSKVIVSVTDSMTGVNATETLTVNNKQRAAEIKFDGIWNKATREKVESIPNDATIENYLLLFTTKDQYGNGAYYNQVDKDLSVTLMTVTGYSAGTGTVEEINGRPYVAYKIVKAADTRDGEVTINSIALFGGKTSQDKFMITPFVKVKKLVVTEGSLGIYDGQENDLSFVAYDQNDKVVTDWKVLKRLNDSKYLTGYKKGLEGRIRFEKRDDKKVYLVYNLSGANALGVAENTTSYQSIGTRTETDEFNNVLVSVRAKRRPVGIRGFKDEVATGVTRGQNLKIAISNLKFEDQYGNSMTAGEIVALQTMDASPYKVVVNVEADNHNPTYVTGNYVLTKLFMHANDQSAAKEFTTANKANILDGDQAIGQLINLMANKEAYEDSSDGNKKKGSEAVSAKLSHSTKVRLALYKGAEELGKHNFDVYNVRLEDVKDFAIKDIPLQATSNLGALAPNDIVTAQTVKIKPEVSGKYAGEKIKLVVADDYVIYGTDATETEAPAGPTDKVITADATVSVVIKNEAGTKIDKTYKYSNEVRKITTIALKPGVTELDLATAGDKGWNDIKGSFVAKDQYGEVIKDASFVPYITVSDNTDLVKVENNGLKTATISLVDKDTPDVITLTLTVPGHPAKFEKVIKVVRKTS